MSESEFYFQYQKYISVTSWVYTSYMFQLALNMMGFSISHTAGANKPLTQTPHHGRPTTHKIPYHQYCDTEHWASIICASGHKEDKIYTVMSSPEGKDGWQTFNKRFDAMFGEDCRDDNGRLHFVHRGLYGMDMVTAYLKKLDVAAMPLDLMALKLVQLNNKIVHILCARIILFDDVYTDRNLPY